MGGSEAKKTSFCVPKIGLKYPAPLLNSIAFGKSTSQRIYPKQHTP